MSQVPAERKSANRLAFEHYLRTGERLTAAEYAERHQVKFNPYHDELGRFTWAPGNGPGGLTSHAKTPAPVAPKPAPKPIAAKPVPSPNSKAEPRRHPVVKRVGGRLHVLLAEVPDYPENRKQTAWRSLNDGIFFNAAVQYNREHKLLPDMPGFKTPEFLKAWAMIESGGEGDKDVFLTDPFQVNNVGDEADPKTAIIREVTQGAPMTPKMSTEIVLRWFDHKIVEKHVQFGDDERTLYFYNGNRKPTGRSEGQENRVWYAKRIMELASNMNKLKIDYLNDPFWMHLQALRKK